MRKEVIQQLKTGAPLTAEMKQYIADVKSLIKFESGVEKPIAIQVLSNLFNKCLKLFKARKYSPGYRSQKRDKSLFDGDFMTPRI